MSEAGIDWDEILRRLDAAGAAIERGYAPSPEEQRRILKKRADLLAQPEEKTVDPESIEIVEFLLANEHYGIESRFIREVYPLKDYTPLPGVPPFVLGLFNVRGRILSIVDVKRFFDLPERVISDLNKVIIIHDDKMEFGVLSDEILGVRNIAVTDLGPPLPTLTGIREEFLKGVTRDRTVILDAARLLTDKAVVVHEQA